MSVKRRKAAKAQAEARAPEKRKGGMPAFECDDDQLRALMRMKPTLEDAATFFACSGRTIERYIKERFDKTFSDFREQHMVKTRYDLVRMAIDRAKTSDTLLIFCLKNLCDWNADRAPSSLVQVKAEASIKTEADKKLVQEFKEEMASYIGERKEPA